MTYIHMIDALTGWGMEATGHIVRTADGGGTWQDVTPLQGAYDRSGFFALDADDAWASPKSWCGAFVGDCQGADQYVKAAVVYHTSDGGQSWQPGQPFSLVSSFSRDQIAYNPHLFFLDAKTGWNIAWVFASHMGEMYQELFKTNDGGTTWRRLAGETDFQQSFMGAVESFIFIDEQTGWAVENGSYDQPASLHKTVDGGLTWTLETIPDIDQLSGAVDSHCIAEMAYRMDKASAVGVGCTGGGAHFFDLTADAGKTWQNWSASSGVRFWNEQTGWRLYSTSNSQPDKFQQTTDGGKTWQTLKVVGWKSAQFDFIDEQTGWAIVTTGDESALVHTANGGKTWKEIKPVAAAPITAKPQINLMRINMFSESSGWARASIADGGAVILHTSDGGQSWKDVTPKIVSDGAYSALYLDGNTAWIYSQNAASSVTLVRTVDGGNSWQRIAGSFPQEFNAGSGGMTFLNQMEGWIENYGVGAGQAYIQIFTTHDGGISWSQVMLADPEGNQEDIPGTLHLCNICSDSFYYDPSRQFITYGDLASDPVGKIRSTISFDLGKTWKQIELPFPSAKFSDAWVAPQAPVFFNQDEGVLPVGLVKLNSDGNHAYDVLAVYATHDGGLNWTSKPVYLEKASNLISSHSAVEFVSPQVAFAACGADLCTTSDGAQTWQSLHSNLNFTYSETKPEYVLQFTFINPITGWAISNNGDVYTLWKTGDGGHTWQAINPLIIYK